MTAQVKPYDPGDSADTSPASGSVQDVGNMPLKLHQASKRVRERSEPKEEKNSPSRPREEPYDPGETAVPGGIHNVQERPEGVRNERVDRTDAPSRDTDPGRDLELQGDSRDVEVEPDHWKVLEDAGYDGKRPRSQENQRGADMNALCRVRGLGGHLGEEVGSGDVEDDRECLSDGEGIEMDGRHRGRSGVPE